MSYLNKDKIIGNSEKYRWYKVAMGIRIKADLYDLFRIKT